MNRKVERVKEFLKQYETSFKIVEECAEQIMLLKQKQMAAGSPNLDGMPKGNNHIDLSDYIVRLELLIEEYEKKRDKERAIMHQVKKTIDSVYDRIDREILSHKYIDFMTFKEIAEYMSSGGAEITTNAVYKRHDKACERIEAWKQKQKER